MPIQFWRVEERGKTFMEQMQLRHLPGLSLRFGHWRVRFPHNLVTVCYFTCSIGLLVNIFLNYTSLAVIIDDAHILIHMVVGYQAVKIATKKKDEVTRVSSLLETFDVPGLEDEGRKIENNVERRLLALYDSFSRTVLISLNLFILFPVSKLLTEARRSDKSKILVWPMWLGVPGESWWGFGVLLAAELVASLFLVLSVLYNVSYLACMGYMAVGQCELLVVALKSMEERAKLKTRHSYREALNSEIDSLARRLHDLYRLANDISDIYSQYLSSMYYGGMWTICFSGFQTKNADQDSEETLKFMGVLFGELIVISFATSISEAVIGGFQDVRAAIYDLPWYTYPKLTAKRLHLMSPMCNFKGFRTVLGYELTLTHLADLLNASYTYYNLLYVSMK